MNTVFAYGSLQLPEVMEAVTGRAHQSNPARLENFVRYRLRRKSFPGIRPKPGSIVPGLVYRDVNGHGLAALDAFEDDFYRRETVQVITADGSQCLAQAYVLRKENYGLLLPEDWNLEAFRRNDLSLFLSSHR